MDRRTAIGVLAIGTQAPAVLAATPAAAAAGPVAPMPTLSWAFSLRAELDPPIEVGQIDGGQRRFIAIKGGVVTGGRLAGVVLSGGGDWQSIMPGGLTHIEAHYFLKAKDGAVIEVTNPGVRTASAEVTARLARGENVDPSDYYFRTTPSFRAPAGPHEWLNRRVFVARGVRRPDHVMIDYYEVL